MRWLINYLRQCFCKHDFDKEEITLVNDLNEAVNIKVSLFCTKCGYHKSFKKY